jgi:hypothetical protein
MPQTIYWIKLKHQAILGFSIQASITISSALSFPSKFVSVACQAGIFHGKMHYECVLHFNLHKLSALYNWWVSKIL